MQNGHDNSIRHRPSHDSHLQQAQTFFLLKYDGIVWEQESLTVVGNARLIVWGPLHHHFGMVCILLKARSYWVQVSMIYAPLLSLHISYIKHWMVDLSYNLADNTSPLKSKTTPREWRSFVLAILLLAVEAKKGFRHRAPALLQAELQQVLPNLERILGAGFLASKNHLFSTSGFGFSMGCQTKKRPWCCGLIPKTATEISFWLLFWPVTLTRNLFQAGVCVYACCTCCQMPTKECQLLHPSSLWAARRKKRVAAPCTGKCDFSASKPLPCYPGYTFWSKRKKMKLIPFQRGGGKHAIIIRKIMFTTLFFFWFRAPHLPMELPSRTSSGSGRGSPWVTFVVGSKSTLVSWP